VPFRESCILYSTAGVTGQQRMFTPPRHLILHLSGVRAALHSILHLLFWFIITFDTFLTSLFYILYQVRKKKKKDKIISQKRMISLWNSISMYNTNHAAYDITQFRPTQWVPSDVDTKYTVFHDYFTSCF
jgi:hypothetical protein